MQCNIDRRGKDVRKRLGYISCAIGTVLMAIYLLKFPALLLLIAGVTILLIGLFQLFEGYMGWCALRAMGMKTRV